ncbi:MAG: Unknown protein [uncultured Sulfurovum sp.]|uniref:Peptidase M50 n=1 Tax=uncultured Sulfurovum sp. TaxID=269237 RepID=A0A6S6S8J5_9BACT|nr:MAG: Unknown protein [uncultured Sulfurovum sp.]
MSEQIFSNSWHIVSGLNVSLLTTVTVQKQHYRGEEWYVLKDSFNNKFFRIKPEAYKFIVRLHTDASVEEIWEEYLSKYPLIAPTQDEVVKLLSQLHLNNLLFFKNKAQSEEVFERYKEQKRKFLKSKVMSFLFIKVPLFNPNRFLDSIHPLTKAIFSRFGFLLWLVMIIYALKIVIDNSSLVSSQVQGMLSPNNLVYLYITLFLLKILHEFGHAMVCKKFGGPVHTLGLMFLVFTPLPYMDASSSWGFRNRWQRVFVGSAGMLVELFIAAVATVIWINTGDGFIHALSFNVMIIGSVSSLIFNANPLLKLDAYYMLSDVLEIPNLAKRANQQFFYFFRKNLFKVANIFPPGRTSKEVFWLNTYAVLSYLYRLLVSLTIMFFVADQIFILGVIVGIMSLFLWVLKPLYSLFNYLLKNPELNQSRAKATLISSIFFASLLIMFMFIPFSNSIRASGVLYAQGFSSVYAPSEGELLKVDVSDGQELKKGDLIVKFINTEMEIEIETLKVNLEETLALELKAQKEISDLEPLKKRVELLKNKIKVLEEKKNDLFVYAEVSGVWISKKIKIRENSFINNGTHLGDIIPQDNFEFIAVVFQEEAYNLFETTLMESSIKVHGSVESTIEIDDIKLIPYKQYMLPSSVLGWLGGGDIKVSQKDPSGRKSMEAFFEIRANVSMAEGNPLLYHHRSGILNIKLADASLLEQFTRYIKQLMQRKYQI